MYCDPVTTKRASTILNSSFKNNNVRLAATFSIINRFVPILDSVFGVQFFEIRILYPMVVEKFPILYFPFEFSNRYEDRFSTDEDNDILS